MRTLNCFFFVFLSFCSYKHMTFRDLLAQRLNERNKREGQFHDLIVLSMLQELK